MDLAEPDVIENTRSPPNEQLKPNDVIVIANSSESVYSGKSGIVRKSNSDLVIVEFAFGLTDAFNRKQV